MRKTLLKKSLVCGIVVLFVGMNVVPIADSSLVPYRPSDHYCHPKFVGNIGNHGWFVSHVKVSFVYNPEIVRTIFYRIIYYEQWLQYTEPFIINEGQNELEWYYIDFSGVQHEINSVSIKIDYTPPMVVLIKEVFFFRIIYTAYPFDNMSGIDRVKFYLNAELQHVAYAPGPYVWTLSPIPHQGYVKVVAYDMAGNNASNPMISNSYSQSRLSSQQHSHNLMLGHLTKYIQINRLTFSKIYSHIVNCR